MTSKCSSENSTTPTRIPCAEFRKLNVVILTQYFTPDGASWFPAEVTDGMVERGHNVKVLTTFPHYTHGQVSHGYKQKLRFTETIGGVEIRRIPILASHSKNPIGRIANYLSFVLSARTAKKYVQDSDVIYVYGTPATVAEPARAWSNNLGIPFVYHVQDIWPESVTQSGFLPPFLLTGMTNVINWWLAKVYSGAAAVIAIAPTARELLIQRGVAADRSHLVYNWSDAYTHRKRHSTDGLSLLYAGNLGEFQDLETIVKAAHRVAVLPNFRLRIAGRGVMEARLKSLVSSLGLSEKVEFLGQIDNASMAQLYAQSDFQIVSLKQLNIFEGTIPSKFQAGLAHGVPVITTVQGDVSQIVEENSLGLVAEPENVSSVAEAMRAAYNLSPSAKADYSTRASDFFIKHFTKDRALNRIEEILLEAAASKCCSKGE